MLCCRVRVDVRIVEQTEAELVPEEPPRRPVDPRLVDASRADELDDDLGARLAAELIDARLDRLERAFLPAQVLDAPRPGRPHDAVEHGIAEQAPVGADDAVEPVALPQEAGDHAAVEAEAHLLVPVPTGIP